VALQGDVTFSLDEVEPIVCSGCVQQFFFIRSDGLGMGFYESQKGVFVSLWPWFPSCQNLRERKNRLDLQNKLIKPKFTVFDLFNKVDNKACCRAH
jgi:hypothetical protein